MAEKLDAMILSAGFGTRLRPLTRGIPKALVPVFGSPLIEIQLLRLRHLATGTYECARVVVNTHHLAHAIEQYVHAVDFGFEVVMSHEEQILGTAGGLRHAMRFFSSPWILTLNVDTLTPIPLGKMLRTHTTGGNAVTLLLVDSDLNRNVQVGGEKVRAILPEKGSDDCFTYTGCQIVNLSFLEELSEGTFLDMRDVYHQLASEGRLGAVVSTGPLVDLGSLEGLLAFHGPRLRKTALNLLPPGSSAATLARDSEPETGFVDPAAEVVAGARVRRSLVLGGSKLLAGSSVEDSIVGPDIEVGIELAGLCLTPWGAAGIHNQATRSRTGTEALPPPGTPKASRQKRTQGARANSPELRTPPGLKRLLEAASGVHLPPQWGSELRRLAGDGSSRRIWRIRTGAIEAVAMEAPPTKEGLEEARRFLEIRELLARWGIDVPRLIAAAPERGLVVLEDLGDQRLYELVRTDREAALARYADVVELAARLHSHAVLQADGAARLNEPYTPEFAMRAEARYFHEELIHRALNLRVPFEAIRKDCESMAQTLEGSLARESAPRLIHRDLQSRNVMIRPGRVVLIDFQGARLGPPLYDLASLLFDPYVELSEDERRSLAGRYHELRRAQEGAYPLPQDPMADKYLLAAAAMRLMQALGAFTKLGLRLGRPGFAEYIPRGLDSLQLVLRALGAGTNIEEIVALARRSFRHQPGS